MAKPPKNTKCYVEDETLFTDRTHPLNTEGRRFSPHVRLELCLKTWKATTICLNRPSATAALQGSRLMEWSTGKQCDTERIGERLPFALQKTGQISLYLSDDTQWFKLIFLARFYYLGMPWPLNLRASDFGRGGEGFILLYLVDLMPCCPFQACTPKRWQVKCSASGCIYVSIYVVLIILAEEIVEEIHISFLSLMSMNVQTHMLLSHCYKGTKFPDITRTLSMVPDFGPAISGNERLLTWKFSLWWF